MRIDPMWLIEAETPAALDGTRVVVVLLSRSTVGAEEGDAGPGVTHLGAHRGD
jgi:hypothetical protein